VCHACSAFAFNGEHVTLGANDEGWMITSHRKAENHQNRLRRNRKFANVFNAARPVQSSHEKYFSFVFSESVLLYYHPASSKRGVRVVTIREVGSGGRERRRETSADERGREIVWSWHSGANAKSALSTSAWATGAISRSPGRSRISVKTAAQGMPVDRLHLW
jgi:hypothetical protein